MSSCPPLLSACELAALQAVAESSLDTPITITPVTGRTGTAGGYTETTGTVVSTMAAFAAPSAPILAQFANRIGGQQAWVMSYPTSIATVKPGDTITITAGAQSGMTFVVHAPLEPVSYNLLNGALVGKAL